MRGRGRSRECAEAARWVWVVVLAWGSLAACGSPAPGSRGACDGGAASPDGACVGTNDGAIVTCGAGTTLVGGACVGTNDAAIVMCGAGTTLVGTTCTAEPSDGPPPPTCGDGTHLVGSTCAPDPSDAGPPTTCGAGTHLVGATCAPDPSDAGPPTTCGAGTHLVGSTCAPDPSDAGPPTTCGVGTHLVGSACAPDPSDAGPPTTCGAGTLLVDASCVAEPSDGPPPVTCGPGTKLVDAACAPDPDAGVATYIVRIATTTIGADGFSAIPVLILGTNADGSPSSATLRLDVSRAGAGTISPSQVTLTPEGSTVYYTPCSSTSASCTGKARVTAAFPSTPNQIIAVSQEFDLVAPTGVGSDTPCLTGGNVLFFDGDAGDFIFSGVQTVTNAAWTASGTTGSVHLNVVPASQTQGAWWDLYFEATKLPTPTLMTQVYDDAERTPFESTGKPGFDLSGDGRGCNDLTARFQIEDLVWAGTTLQSMTATFEQHCEGATQALRGCMHYEN